MEHHDGRPEQHDREPRESAHHGLERSCHALLLGSNDIVVLDEVDVAISFGLLSLDSVLEMIALRPQHVELVLTGRQAPPELIARADLVTEMREVAHYYRDGVLARSGIEY